MQQIWMHSWQNTDDETDMNTICQLASEVAKDNRQKDVEVLFEPAKENLLIRSNSERISQVLNNLAHNAAKFTTHGSIRIAYSVLEAEKKIEISVTDTGTGIPKDQQEAVFERFYKMNSFITSSSARNYADMRRSRGSDRTRRASYFSRRFA